MRFTLLLAAAAFLVAPASSQTLLTENFDYAVGDTLTAPPQPWIHHSGSGDSLLVTDNNLTFTGYSPSTGNSTFVAHGGGSREDAHLDFTPVSFDERNMGAATVYAALLVNVSSTATDADGGYFFHLTQENQGFDFRGRIFIRTAPSPLGGGSLFNFGISKANTSTEINWENVNRTEGTTYLLVMKYTFVPDAEPAAGGAQNDPVDLFIFEDGDDISVEPVSPDLSNIDTASDLLNAGNVNLRQGGDTMGLTVDGIQVGLGWADVIQGDDPGVSITCTADAPPIVIPAAGGSYVWNIEIVNNAATEVTFDIWIDIDGPGVDLTKGPFVRTLAAGASLSRPLTMNVPGFAPGGAYTHTCNVGTFATPDDSDSFDWTKEPPCLLGCRQVVESWSTEAGFEAQLDGSANTVGDIPGTHVLEAAYPNPFNPEATFNFAVSEQQYVRADLVDMLGRVVATLFDGNVETGSMQTVRIDGADLPSGMYMVRLTGETFSDSQQVTLLK